MKKMKVLSKNEMQFVQGGKFWGAFGPSAVAAMLVWEFIKNPDAIFEGASDGWKAHR